MGGRFMDKETLEAEAARLSVDLEGLTWPQKQSAVMEAQREEVDHVASQLGLQASKVHEDVASFEITAFASTPSGADRDGDDLGMPVAQEPVVIHVPRDPMEDMRGKTLMICPEMAATANQLFGYDEVLDDELLVEEVVHDVDAAYKAGRDELNGTYNIVGRTGKKVIAKTALPKEGAGIYFTPDRDWVPRVRWRGREGYLWTHQSLPNIKALLIQSGYYEDYRSRFTGEPTIWHAAGKILACDINLVESIFREIERRERERKVQQSQATAFIENQMRP